MKITFHTLLLFLLLTGTARAFEPFVVSDVRVEGLQRISAGTVFNYLPVKVGDTVDTDGSAAAIRALFKTGFFNDVYLERDGNILVVHVTERAAISSIEIKVSSRSGWPRAGFSTAPCSTRSSRNCSASISAVASTRSDLTPR